MWNPPSDHLTTLKLDLIWHDDKNRWRRKSSDLILRPLQFFSSLSLNVLLLPAAGNDDKSTDFA